MLVPAATGCENQTVALVVRASELAKVVHWVLKSELFCPDAVVATQKEAFKAIPWNMKLIYFWKCIV